MHRSYDPLTGKSLTESPGRQPSPFRSKEIVVTLETPGQRVKIFRIDWLKSEVGLSVGLRYFSPSHAVIGRYENPRGDQGRVSLLEGGKVTRQPVKLSFHKSGTVLFSQTKKIDPIIRTNSSPLVGKPTHLFSVYVRGPDGFEAADHKDGSPPAPYRAIWNLTSGERGAVGFKIVAHWFPLSVLEVTRSEPGRFGHPNLVHLRIGEGEFVSGFLFAPIPSWPWAGYALLLSQEPWSIESGHQQPYILIAGGFAQPPHRSARNIPATFLAGMYTDRSTEIDDLTRQLGSVDIATIE